ncbi:hypothetical protein BS47DRAFT_1352096, partial [Hydnum rufescens UP504]
MLHNEKEAAKEEAGGAKAHANEVSCRSFASSARVMNTTEALTQIEEQRSAAIAEVAKKDELKCQKEDNPRRTAFFKCAQRVAKHFSDLQTKAQKKAEKELKEHLNREEREAAKVAKAAKAVEKVAAKQAEREQKARAKAEKAALDAATKGHKGVSSRGKGKQSAMTRRMRSMIKAHLRSQTLHLSAAALACPNPVL